MFLCECVVCQPCGVICATSCVYLFEFTNQTLCKFKSAPLIRSASTCFPIQRRWSWSAWTLKRFELGALFWESHTSKNNVCIHSSSQTGTPTRTRVCAASFFLRNATLAFTLFATAHRMSSFESQNVDTSVKNLALHRPYCQHAKIMKKETNWRSTITR